MKEKNIEQYLIEKVKEKNGLCLKFTSPGCAGVPDRIVIFPGGRIIFVELKSVRGSRSRLQRYIHNKLTSLGCSLVVIDSYKKVDIFMALFGEEL